MCEFRVPAIRDDARLEPVIACRPRNDRQEAAEPCGEFGRFQDPPHQVRLGEARRKEVLARGLVRQGAVNVTRIVGAAALVDERAHRAVSRNHGPVAHEPECKRGLGVLADANRVAKLRQPLPDTVRSLGFERREHGGPATRVGIVPAAQLSGQLQQPGQSIGALEGRASGILEVSQLGGNLLLGEARGEGGPRGRCKRRRRVIAREPREQPMAVHRRMPVEATEENRRQAARRPHVRVAPEHVRNLVRILTMNAGERELREAARGGLVHDRIGPARRQAAGERGQECHPRDSRDHVITLAQPGPAIGTG